MKIIRPTDIGDNFESSAPPDNYVEWRASGRDFLTRNDFTKVFAEGSQALLAYEFITPEVFSVDLATGDSDKLSLIGASIGSPIQVSQDQSNRYVALSTKNYTQVFDRTESGSEVLEIPLGNDATNRAGQLHAWSDLGDKFFSWVYGAGQLRVRVYDTATWTFIASVEARQISGANVNPIYIDDIYPLGLCWDSDSASLFVSFIHRYVPDGEFSTRSRHMLAKINPSNASHTAVQIAEAYSNSSNTEFNKLIANPGRSEILMHGSPNIYPVARSNIDMSFSIRPLDYPSSSIDIDGAEMIAKNPSVQPYWRRYSATDYSEIAALDPALPANSGAVKYSSDYYVAILEDGGYALIDRVTDTIVKEINPTVTDGDIYTYQNTNYEALSNNSDRPDLGATLDTPTWLNLGAVNPLRMFDGKLDTLTTAPSPLTVNITPGQLANGIALFNVTAQTVQITMTDPVEGHVYDSGVITMLDNAAIKNWYSFFFEPYLRKADVARIDLPPYPDATVTVTLSAPGEDVSAGQLALGKIRRIGETQYGTSVGITDFSRKEQDQFGNFSITPRRFSKRAEYDIKIDSSAVAGAQRTLAKLRTTPLVWVGAESQEETLVYGYYRDFDIVIATYSLSDVTITVEGL